MLSGSGLMSDHNCRGCKHRNTNTMKSPCLHCKRVHRLDKYEMRPPKTETWYQCIPSINEKHYNKQGMLLNSGIPYWWWEPIKVTLIE